MAELDNPRTAQTGAEICFEPDKSGKPGPVLGLTVRKYFVLELEHQKTRGLEGEDGSRNK